MLNLTAKLTQDPLLKTLAGLLPGFPHIAEIHLVGGAVRDALLGLPSIDFDLTASHDPTPLAQTFASHCGGYWFWLDKRRRQSRVGIAGRTFDFAPWRAPTLAEDLAKRDFTINTMAIELVASLASPALIDPLAGAADLSSRTLRCAGHGVLLDDPLRILKGIRHAVELELTIDQATLCAMQSAVVSLPDQAPERLRLELWRIMASPAAGRGIEWLVVSGAGEVLFGPGLRSAYPKIRKRLLDSHQAFAELSAAMPQVADWLHEPVEQGLDRATLLRWHFVLSAIDRELPLALAQRWRFSRLALDRLAALQRVGPQLWLELRTLPWSPRPVALWACQYAPDPVDLLLFLGLLPDDKSISTREILVSRLRLLSELPNPKQVPPLVAGGWLQSDLGVNGAAIGAAHAELRAAEISGEVSNEDEARRYLLAHRPEIC